jgi:hypothetical protein
VDGSRPSSSYSIGQLRFEKDMFTSSSEWTISTRSTLNSRSSERGCASDVCAAIPEELEEPDLQLADVGVFGDSGEFVAEYHPRSCGGAPVIRCAQVEWSDVLHSQNDKFSLEEEYDAGAADDLALRMDVPPPASDEESDDDEAISTADDKPRAPGLPRGGALRPTRKKLAKGSDKSHAKVAESSQSSSKDWFANFEEKLRQLEAPKSLETATEQVRSLAAELRRCKSSQQTKALPKLLRATLQLMDRQEVETISLLRLAHVALDLLSLLVGVAEDSGGDGVQAAYMNIAKALFKLSKDAGHDSLFKSEGLLDALLALLTLEEVCGKSADLRIFVVGILKNVTNNDDNVKYITKRGVLPALATLTKSQKLKGHPKEAQLFVQITALLRNLAASSKRNQQLVELGLLDDLMRISAQYATDTELQINIARVLAKLSLHDAPCDAFEAHPSHMRQVIQCLSSHADVPSLVLRLSFVLGNLTSRSDKLREMFWFECEGRVVLPSVLQRYWQKDRKLAQAEIESLARGADAVECEGVLVKLVRLAANVAITQSVGMELAASPDAVNPLLDILGCKRMTQSEELVLNTVAATTNLLFYGESGNLLFSVDNKELLCRLLRPLLLESYNVEALVEVARALGNLSRHQDARQWMAELRIDEILAILMAHDDRDLVFYACGALVNVAADATRGARLCSCINLRTKLAAVLSDAPADDRELQLVAVKVLLNLRLTGNCEVPWSRVELSAVSSSLERIQHVLEHTLDANSGEVSNCLAGLVARLQEALPQCPEDAEDGMCQTQIGGSVKVELAEPIGMAC